MKTTLRKWFSPLLSIFESGDDTYEVRKSHRNILIAVGLLFLVLATVSGYFTLSAGQLGGLIPCFIFFAIGFVCEVVALLGTDKAVAKIWGSK